MNVKIQLSTTVINKQPAPTQSVAFHVSCDFGYEGNGIVCEDFDECLNDTHSCAVNATCHNLNGNFSCTCDIGFSGDGFFCDDQDECEFGIHHCHDNASCSDVIGSYVCACNLGYTGDGERCDDLTECELELDDCHDNAACFNSLGSFSCACKSGFSVTADCAMTLMNVMALLRAVMRMQTAQTLLDLISVLARMDLREQVGHAPMLMNV